MPEFPHLPLKRKLNGKYHFVGNRIEKKVDERTVANLVNRTEHGEQLLAGAKQISDYYTQFINKRTEEGLPDIFNPDVLPVFLQVDPKDFDIESLKGFGIEIVAEEDEGFIIGANADNFSKLAEKIDKFIREQGKTKNTAKLWQIIQGTQWRVEYILSPYLREKYMQGIGDTEEFVVDISVACYVKVPEKPIQKEEETEEDYAESKAKYQEQVKYDLSRKNTPYRKRRERESDVDYDIRLKRWERKYLAAEEEKDEIASQRQTYLINFIQNVYHGEILSGFIDLEDSFGFRARLSGQALKDLVIGYPYVFEICESELIDPVEEVAEMEGLEDIDIIAPTNDSPTVCIIDSGIQEKHLMLESSVLPAYSQNYVPYEDTTTDLVASGGHGTKVAGAVLFGNEIPSQGTYQPSCFLLNARILDRDNRLSDQLYPPQLMERIVADYDGTRIFNLSVASRSPCRTEHMSAWAATIDKITHEKQVLFLLAVGNIPPGTGSLTRPGVTEHLSAGRDYPNFLLENTSRIANPSQSMLGLTVGSVCHAEFEDADRYSFGKRDHVSAFSRTGPGLWLSIKPDVVEYGGDMLREKNGFLITFDNTTSAHVVKTGANRTGYDTGTSYATPKVAHIVAALAKKFPNESVLLYKALIVQSARLPEHVFHQPSFESLRMLGYGIPDKIRSLENSPYRITFVAEGKVSAQQANLYSINVPDELRRAGTNYDILIEVTLTYTASPRRTRKRLKSYLSSWLSWDTSKLGESFDDFSIRVLKDMGETEQTDEPSDTSSIRWAIWSSPVWGTIKGVKRQDSCTQKDWTVLKSNQLPAELSFAIVGHKGWDTDFSKELPFALVVSFEALGKETEIYEQIEAVNRIEIEQEIDMRAN